MLGALWYVGSVSLAFWWLLGSKLARNFSYGELAAAAIPVGTIGGAWLVYLCGCHITGALGFYTIALATAIACVAVYYRLPVIWNEVGGFLLGPAALLPATASSAAASPFKSGGSAAGPSPTLASAVTPPISALNSLSGFGSSPLRSSPRFSGTDLVAWGTAGALGLLFWPMFSGRMIPEVDGRILSGNGCYGDLPIHMAIANSFLVGVNQEISWGRMMSPIFAGEHMTYPFLPDFHAAILVALGSSMRTGFLLPGWAMASSLWALLVYFTVRVTRSRLGGVLAVALTICAGGMGGWRWAQQRGWDIALSEDVVQHDVTGQWKFWWFAFIPHIMLPQRGGCFAYPMAVLSLLLAWVATDESEPRRSLQDRGSLLLHAALAAASLPLVQAHAFLGVGVIIACFFLLDCHKWLKRPRLFAYWLLAGLAALAGSVPQLLMFRKTLEQGSYGHFLDYRWHFLREDKEYHEFGAPGGLQGFLRFWYYSLGPATFLFYAATGLALLEAVQAVRLAGMLSKSDDGPNRFLKAVHATLPLEAASAAAAAGGAGGGVGEAAGKGSGMGGGGGGAAVLPLSTRRPHGSAAVQDVTMQSDCCPDWADVDHAAHGLTLLLSALGWKEAAVGGISSSAAAAAASTHDSKGTGAGAGKKLDLLLARAGHANSLSVTGRALDTLKLCLGAFAVFLIGNYVNFQPWDRDNAKIFYIFIFVHSTVSGSLLAWPAEALLGAFPGSLRWESWVATVSGSLLEAPQLAASIMQYSGLSLKDSGSSSSASSALSGNSKAGLFLQQQELQLAKAAMAAASSGMMSSGSAAAGGGAGASLTAALTNCLPGQMAAEIAAAAGGGAGGGKMMSSSGLASPSSIASGSKKGRLLRLLSSTLMLPIAAALLFFSTLSGGIVLWQEMSLQGNGILLDEDAQRMGEWIKGNTPPGAVVMHSNYHVQPSCSIAGRPSLVAYFGWVNNHGYNCNERLKDRDYVMSNALKDKDDQAYFLLRRWGVRYILGENMRRPQGYKRAGAGGQEGEVYLEGKLKLVRKNGRYELFQVL